MYCTCNMISKYDIPLLQAVLLFCGLAAAGHPLRVRRDGDLAHGHGHDHGHAR